MQSVEGETATEVGWDFPLDDNCGCRLVLRWLPSPSTSNPDREERVLGTHPSSGSTERMVMRAAVVVATEAQVEVRVLVMAMVAREGRASWGSAPPCRLHLLARFFDTTHSRRQSHPRHRPCALLPPPLPSTSCPFPLLPWPSPRLALAQQESGNGREAIQPTCSWLSRPGLAAVMASEMASEMASRRRHRPSPTTGSPLAWVEA